MVQVIEINCSNSLISDAFSSSGCIISNNRILSQIQVLIANLKEIELCENPAVDGSIILKWILN